MNALPFPLRLTICGKCESGKTTLGVQIMKEFILPKVQRCIFVCPSYSSQDAFRDFDTHVVKERDVFEFPDDKIFEKIHRELHQQYCFTKERGLPRINTIVFVDDSSGLHCVHGGRMSSFGNLAVNARHLGASMMVLTHNLKNVAPLFRENLNALITFPSNAQDKETLFKEFNPNQYGKDQFYRMVQVGLEGGEGEEGLGKHFLCILMYARSPARYFSDFQMEIKKTSLSVMA